IVQNKLHFAAHGQTAAEVIASRADASLPNMGLTTFPGERPRKADVRVAKNYLDESELKKLNSLVSAYFDAAEFRAQNHEPTYMKDWLAHLDRLIVALDARTLDNAGSVSHQQAVARADGEYVKYRASVDAEPAAVEAAYLKSIKNAQREVAGGHA
ncbi:MAG: RhuM family protein, partial [Candidatus Nanopelagicales bacterium]